MKLCANSISILENIHLVKEEAPDSWMLSRVQSNDTSNRNRKKNNSSNFSFFLAGWENMEGFLLFLWTIYFVPYLTGSADDIYSI